MKNKYYSFNQNGIWIKDPSILTFEIKEAKRESVFRFDLLAKIEILKDKLK
jgi:hypothetical protein